MASQASPRLPLDVFELIIKEVASQDDENNRYHDLQACAIACRDFLPLSRRHLFRSVAFYCFDQYGWKKYRRFESTLTSSPEIALYVRDIEIVDNKEDLCIVNQPSLPGIIGMLINVSVFWLLFRRNFDWNDFTPQLKESLVTMFTSPSSSLETLHICGICNLPPAAVKWIMCIPTVSLTQVGFKGQDEEVDYVLSQTAKGARDRSLTTLALCELLPINSQPLLNGLSSCDCQLRTLILESGEVIPVAAAIMRNHRATLAALEFPRGFLEDDALRLHGFDITALTDLYTIKFFASFHLRNPFKNLKCVMSNAGKVCNAKEIILDLLFAVVDWLLTSNLSDWESVDRLLSSSLFTGLQQVYIKAGTRPKDGTLPTGYVKLRLWKILPRAYQKGLLKLESNLYDFFEMHPVDI